MRFHVQPLQEFLVRPAIPDAFPRLPELAYNVLWSWDRTMRALFRRLDAQLWLSTGRNPILMLSQLPAHVLEKAAGDPRHVSLYRRACERLDQYLERYNATPKEGLIAYFCMEFGVVQCLPVYSGGLGILAGDHLKAASDLGLPLTAVGLLYQQGYFRQALNPDGWQLERYPLNDFYTLPINPVRTADHKILIVSVDFPAGPLFIKVWQMNVGGIQLYLLDTNIPENANAEYRAITDQLYGGDLVKRLRQEIVLGIGGLRALKAMGVEPTVYHMNEGHSSFLALERIRLLMQDGKLTFAQALDASASNNVFTSHTCVPAGFDLYEPPLIQEYFQRYCEQAGIPFDAFLSLGRDPRPDAPHTFNMAVAALNASSYRNAVSRFHQDISQEMFQHMWPQLPTWEVPITSVTNGVHMQSWVNGDLASLYSQYLQPDWDEHQSNREMWQMVSEIPDSELWEAHRRRKRRLIQFVRARATAAARDRKAASTEVRRLAEALDPDALTIGFARRFATYKRATLLFTDAERLRRILLNPERPVQILIAGKAHPKDHPGKNLIREIYNLSRDPELSRRILFVEDYSIEAARELVAGVDLWLNNPRRGEEACGTSGMKAGINGVLNLSIFDGWFDEGYEDSGGWAIGDRLAYSQDQDDIHATAIYSMLENEIVPIFYTRDRGIPIEWMRRVKHCLTHLSPQFNCARMVSEYNELLYLPAHRAWSRVTSNDFESVRERAVWLQKVRESWEHVRFVDAGPALTAPVRSGQPIPIRAAIDLAGLTPDDVVVEAVIGRVGPEGHLEDTTVVTMTASKVVCGHHVFERQFVPDQSGKLGYSLRLSPNHSDDPLTRPCNALMRWASVS